MHGKRICTRLRHRMATAGSIFLRSPSWTSSQTRTRTHIAISTSTAALAGVTTTRALAPGRAHRMIRTRRDRTARPLRRRARDISHRSRIRTHMHTSRATSARIRVRVPREPNRIHMRDIHSSSSSRHTWSSTNHRPRRMQSCRLTTTSCTMHERCSRELLQRRTT